MTTEEKFRAAANVIRNLPKNGSYQPSTDLMLRFYAYYKQATEGPCVAPYPPFWEIVKRKKWEAWSKLGNMATEQAMHLYVEELKRIVETMSYTDNVANFLGSLGSFYDSVPMGDLELLVGDVIERIRSQPGSPLNGSPFGSREASPNRIPVRTNGHHMSSSLETSPNSSNCASPQPEDVDDEDEEFIDSVETEPEYTSKEANHKSTAAKSQLSATTNGNAIVPNERLNHSESADMRFMNHERGRPKERSNSRPSLYTDSQPASRVLNVDSSVPDNQLSAQIALTVSQLQKDRDALLEKIRNMENTVKSLQKSRVRSPKWWPFREISPRLMTFIVFWPILCQLGMLWLHRRRRNHVL